MDLYKRFLPAYNYKEDRFTNTASSLRAILRLWKVGTHRGIPDRPRVKLIGNGSPSSLSNLPP